MSNSVTIALAGSAIWGFVGFILALLNLFVWNDPVVAVLLLIWIQIQGIGTYVKLLYDRG